MAKVDEKSKSGAQKAVDAKPHFEGPHRNIHKKKKSEASTTGPAYVVTVTKKEKSEEDEIPSTKQAHYNPQEQRAKAHRLTHNDRLTSDQRDLLKEILGPDEKEKPV